jgi:hypothetical protein
MCLTGHYKNGIGSSGFMAERFVESPAYLVPSPGPSPVAMLEPLTVVEKGVATSACSAGSGGNRGGAVLGAGRSASSGGPDGASASDGGVEPPAQPAAGVARAHRRRGSTPRATRAVAARLGLDLILGAGGPRDPGRALALGVTASLPARGVWR